MNGYEIKARRHARELVDDLRWQGISVPPVYAHMADEFQDLVGSGGYAAWVGGHPEARPVRRPATPGGHLRPHAAEPAEGPARDS